MTRSWVVNVDFATVDGDEKITPRGTRALGISGIFGTFELCILWRKKYLR
jgi:hypothetical protein